MLLTDVAAHVVETQFLRFPEIEQMIVTLQQGRIGTITRLRVLTSVPSIRIVPYDGTLTLKRRVPKQGDETASVNVLYGPIVRRTGQFENRREEVLNHHTVTVHRSALSNSRPIDNHRFAYTAEVSRPLPCPGREVLVAVPRPLPRPDCLSAIV